jgi:hypothetical protein
MTLIDTRVTFAGHSCRQCRHEIATIAQGEAANLELHCEACGQRRGLLSHRTADLITAIIGKFGAPNSPIILRRSPE